MNLRKWSLSGLMVLACIAGYAQSSFDSTNHNDLDEVVITATKYPVKLSQTGKVVTVISREQIERSGGKSLSQLLTEQTGIIVNGANSSPGKDKSIYIRGAKNNYTLILLDGVPVSDVSSIGGGGAFDLRLIPMEAIDRIEILKGSQSSLYGSDAVAGVINIITKKGGNKPFGVSGGAVYGSYNTFDGNVALRGSSKYIDYNVGYDYTSTDGISEAKDSTGHANFDKDGFNRHSFQTNISIKPTDNLKISPFYRYAYYKGDFDGGAYVDANNSYDYMYNNAGMNATYQLKKGTVTANYGYTFAKRSYSSGQSYPGKFQNADLYMHYTLGKQVQMLAGLNYQRNKIDDTTFSVRNPSSEIVSPYLSFFIQSGTGLNLEIGGRYNHHSEFGSFATYSFNTSYVVDDRLKFFANVSTGFKAPTLSQLYGMWGANPDLQPEKSTNLEGGFQLGAWQKKAKFAATVFYREVDDRIDYYNNHYVNFDSQKDHGIELEASVKPSAKWDVKAAYTFVIGKEVLKVASGKDSTLNENLIRVPKNTFLLRAGYQATPRLYVSASLQSVGKRNDLFFNNLTYASVPVTLKTYTLLNAYAEYKFLNNKLKIFVDAKNLTDTDYEEIVGYNTMGINVNAGVAFSF